MTTTKTVFTLTSIAFLALFGGGLYLFANLGDLAKGAIEKAASQTLGVPVRIASLEVKLQDKRAYVQNLTIGNPGGFLKPLALSVDNISVKLGHISQGLVLFEDILVSGTNVYLEVGERGTNLTKIKEQIKVKSAGELKEESGQEPVKVIIDRLVVADAQLNPSVVLFSDANLEPVHVPRIVLSGIGQKENGLLVREAVGQVFTQLASQFSAAAQDAGFYRGLSGDALKDLGVGQIDAIKSDVKGAIDGAIKGIFDE